MARLDVPPLILPYDLMAAGKARRFVEGALSGAAEEVRAIAVLLTSELVANAVEHGLPPVTIRILEVRGALRIEVDDGGVAAADARPGARKWSTSAEDGRGLLLVEALAAVWGCVPHRHATGGQTSWFELALT